MTRPPPPPAACLAAALLGAGLLAVGCTPHRDGTVPNPPSRPDLEKVLISEDHGRNRFRDAETTLRAYLVHHPEDAEAHLDMGILLFDALAQYPESIFHFQAFLDARPGSEKAEVARMYIEEAVRQLSGAKSDAPIASGDDTASPRELELVEHVEELNRALARKDGEIAAVSNRVDTLERECLRLANENGNLQRRMDILLKGGDATPSKSNRPSPALVNRQLEAPPSTRPSAPAPGATRGTYEVQKNDTLWGIAQKVYGDASRNVDIRKANPGKIGPNDSLTEGDILVIP